MTLSPLQRSLLSGIAGFVAYGGWAFWVNAPHSLEMGVMAGILQGSYSFLLTLGMTLVMEYLMQKLSVVPGRAILTVILASSGTLSVAYGIQWLNGTPEILLTILPGFVIGTVYSAVYVAGLNRVDATGLQK